MTQQSLDWAFLGEALAGLGVYLLIAILLVRLRLRRWHGPKKRP